MFIQGRCFCWNFADFDLLLLLHLLFSFVYSLGGCDISPIANIFSLTIITVFVIEPVLTRGTVAWKLWWCQLGRFATLLLGDCRYQTDRKIYEQSQTHSANDDVTLLTSIGTPLLGNCGYQTNMKIYMTKAKLHSVLTILARSTCFACNKIINLLLQDA